MTTSFHLYTNSILVIWRLHSIYIPTLFLSYGCLWSLSWRHSTRLGLLQLLWGSAPESNRHNGVQWSEKTVRALPCSHTLCWKDSGPSWTGSSHSVLSGRQCHLHYSSQVRQPTKGCLWLRVRSWSRPGLAERKPCLRCPKLNCSARRPSLRLLREAGRRSGQECVLLVQNDGYILGIYQVYTVIYTFWVNTALCVTLTWSLPWYTWADVYPFIWDLVGACFTLEIMYKSKNWIIHSLYQVYAIYIPGIYHRIFQH
jgi:hypothetical protein